MQLNCSKSLFSFYNNKLSVFVVKHVHVVILKESRYLHYMFFRFLVITGDDKYKILHFLFMVVMRVTENASITLNVFFLYNFHFASCVLHLKLKQKL